MAIRNTTTPTPAPTAAPSAKPVATTPVRNSPVPKPASSVAGARRQPTHAEIAARAYAIWQSGRGGSQDENWFRAERELRGL